MSKPTKPLGGNTITVVRAQLVIDPRDNSLYRDWVNASQTVVERCMVEPYPLAEKLNVEDMRDREFVRTALRVYAPKTTDIIYTDRVLFNGLEYRMFGDAGNWFHLNGALNHLAFIIRRVYG